MVVQLKKHDPKKLIICVDFRCYEENLSMARGKPQQTEMTAEINSNLRYAI
jgi:hypothetical protein